MKSSNVGFEAHNVQSHFAKYPVDWVGGAAHFVKRIADWADVSADGCAGPKFDPDFEEDLVEGSCPFYWTI